MSQYFKKLIDNLTNKPTGETTHNLFTLGTGVDFVPTPSGSLLGKEYYIRGDTFSYTALLTAHMLGQTGEIYENAHVMYPSKLSYTKNEQYAHSYSSPSVDVINGPDVPGQEIGDRVAKGLMLALCAIAQGKTRICASGFSRGGVEVSSIISELVRVRDALREDLKTSNKNPRSLATIIADSNSVLENIYSKSTTKAALNELLICSKELIQNEKEDIEFKLKLLDKLNNFTVQPFALDPVPGDNYSPILRGLEWQEDAFYEWSHDIIDHNNEYLILQQDETSNCFKPYIPKGYNPDHIEVLPGCHGTGAGNQNDQNNRDITKKTDGKIEKVDVSGVQDIVLMRWLERKYDPGTPVVTPIKLGHPELDDLSTRFIPADEHGRDLILLETYKKIQKNMPGFRSLRDRHYDFLGHYDNTGIRKVHNGKKGDYPISKLESRGDGYFVNRQHMELWIKVTYKKANFSKISTIEKLAWSNEAIETTFKPNLNSSLSNGADVLQRLNIDNEKDAMEKVLFVMINTVSDTYFGNSLTVADEKSCADFVNKTNEFLSNVQSDESRMLAISMKKTISDIMTMAMLKHQDSLLGLVEDVLYDQKNAIHAEERNVDEKAKVNKQNDIKLASEKIQILINTEKLHNELNLLHNKIKKFAQWCDLGMLEEAWGKLNKKPEISNDPEKRKIQLVSDMQFHIKKQKTLLLDSASELSKCFNGKPEGLSNNFYNKISTIANKDMNKENTEELGAILIDKIDELQREKNENKKNKAEILRLTKQCIALEKSNNNVKSETQSQHENALKVANETLTAIYKNDRNKLNAAHESIVNEKNKTIHDLQKNIDNLNESNGKYEREQGEKLRILSEKLDEKQSRVAELERAIQLDAQANSLAKRTNLENENKIKTIQENHIQVINAKNNILRENGEKINRLENRNNELVNKIAQNEDALRNLQDEKETMQIQFQNKLKSIQEDHLNEVTELDDILREKDTKINRLENRNNELTNQIVANEDALKNLQDEKETMQIQFQNKLKSIQEDHLNEVTQQDNLIRVKDANINELENRNIDLLNQIEQNNNAVKNQQEENTNKQKEKKKKKEHQQQMLMIDNLAGENHDEQDELERLRRENEAFKSPAQASNAIIVQQLIERTLKYQSHLNNRQNGSVLRNTKVLYVREMLAVLQDNTQPSTQQLHNFNRVLAQAGAHLKEHRDQEWKRFFYDIGRILGVFLSYALACAPAGIYKRRSGHWPTFFSPTKGEKFVEEAKIIANHAVVVRGRI